MWSVIPLLYAGFAAYYSNYDPRMTIMALLVVIWGSRLTFNFGRRGGYSSWIPWEGDEDYRWEILRKNPTFQNPVIWNLFHIFFICIYQMGLIFLMVMPIIMAYNVNPLTGSAPPLTLFDFGIASWMLCLVAIETLADNQQYIFQTEKYRRINAGESLHGTDYERGFICSGLWGRSRHPNYFCEQSIWVVFYLFSVVATGEWLNVSGVGSVLLLLLFQGSADFSEEITAKKYPLYKTYLANTNKFLISLSLSPEPLGPKAKNK
jgi:steroid 5-alpha reductase family enzyme